VDSLSLHEEGRRLSGLIHNVEAAGSRSEAISQKR
jgi:hypothetical protein